MSAGDGLFVWDLGYVSTAECKLVASVGLGGGDSIFCGTGHRRWASFSLRLIGKVEFISFT